MTDSTAATVEELSAKLTALELDVDTAWLVITGGTVFFMQAGFSMLEAGCVSSKNVINILFKNIMDGAIAAVCFWLIGYGIGFGDTAGGFIGTSNFGLSDYYAECAEGMEGVLCGRRGYAHWFFQWAFAGTAATIVSGSVAERTKFEAYLMFSAICSIVIYPVVVHWVWGHGWLSSHAMPDDEGFHPILKGNSDSNGMLDFGGSGVVHMLGGCSGLMGAIAVGPRRFRFDEERKPRPMPPHNSSMMALGATILWFGWYSFNCGSTLSISHNKAVVAGKVAINTTIAGATGALVATIISRIFEKTFDIGIAINGLLAGMVAITAGCAIVETWAAFLIGVAAPFVYYGAHLLLLRFGVDDPLDAFPIHGCGGAFGVLAAGIFCQDELVDWAGYPHTNKACQSGEQFAVQLIGVLIITIWSLVMAGGTFFMLKAVIGLRVPEEIEDEGLDRSEHGGMAYFDNMPKGNQVTPFVSEPAGTSLSAVPTSAPTTASNANGWTGVPP
mmetsp:Transcript_56343/g.115226  ORF Transcript_56343/g.115226 Transcript_56343/m.115226 type:complete len:500 (+) Transcript_56343:105-1604(+)|eukprot:CAMPEP_0181333876 /NCGR_PEP_ID=MMETSP1101-20121128/25938_1 /TAXON_ID=46948 /ORGANISM="Rhodomonas abbreviata, Strain Caron Lab Isolate" /LENGTH=499 /DNA_ID=CAMNT_0023443771 /DNA_START=84 /DNA_END=1583 /DNA_ORIENTATION=-